jgi:hypothetical protein
VAVNSVTDFLTVQGAPMLTALVLVKSRWVFGNVILLHLVQPMSQARNYSIFFPCRQEGGQPGMGRQSAGLLGWFDVLVLYMHTMGAVLIKHNLPQSLECPTPTDQLVNATNPCRYITASSGRLHFPSSVRILSSKAIDDTASSSSSILQPQQTIAFDY